MSAIKEAAKALAGTHPELAKKLRDETPVQAEVPEGEIKNYARGLNNAAKRLKNAEEVSEVAEELEEAVYVVMDFAKEVGDKKLYKTMDAASSILSKY